MRPESLFPLFVPVTALPGVGPRLAPLYQRLAGDKVVDLLWHRPSGLVDRRYCPTLAEAIPGRVATLTVRVEAHLPGDGGRRPYKVRVADDTGFAHLVYFHPREGWLRELLPEGAIRVVSGMVEGFYGEITLPHPDHVVPPERRAEVMTVEATYPLTAGLTLRPLTRAIRAALDRAPDLPEWLDPSWRDAQGWPGWREALRRLHAPTGPEELGPDNPARRRLAYDELLSGQLALALVRAHLRRRKGRALAAPSQALRAKVLAALPFSPTGAQIRALAEIDADLARPAPMLRLLQGDVGSGKTLVAFLALLTAIEAGSQGALMAPTEILARQHFASLEPLAATAGIRLGLLTGRDKGKVRAARLADLAEGAIDLLIGTHALFQEDVVFRDLGLAVIDEQHRFGVHQRLDLAAKGHAVDMLVMTATPIPRTLLLSAYGDMDYSRLDEKPPGRTPIDTRVVPLARLDEMVAAVGRALEAGARVYWVCPLVEESEQSDLAAAERRFADLAEVFGARVGLVHGKMRPTARDAVMGRFASGEITLLVATTVIEVGVDVPEATVMVVEHAERFGLAQLHQLRGRVGRGSGRSRCLLLYATPLGEIAKARLEILRASDDGFVIAEEDLRLRGGGEILGTRQSGLPEYRLADLASHGSLLEHARGEAEAVLERDPDLASPRGAALRVLLYLFERDAAIHTLKSG
ncbi:ATP-dependent DNA helicase RecG [Phaeospirillum tilakii]|uniref:ATP-dependent DNA helicase RecG n=1 Tax=Phaeospirillum tilakii TaxID=741673 RepID=A0ABW5CC89_9PROT